MGKKVEVSYNPQLGYLQTIFHHNFDFLTGIKSYTERTDGVEFVVDTYKENTVKVFIQCVGESILENAFYENSGECFILTGEQELFHIGEDLYQKEEKGYIFDKSQKMMKENLIVDTFQSKGKNFYISSRQNMLSGWKIIQVIPEERLFEEVDQKIKWNSIFLLGALILVVSFSIYYTKKLLNH